MERYQFVKQIGRGSYGEVWLVRCSNTKKKYVLKRVDLHRASKHEQRAAHQEAKLLSTVKHPNIVNYLDSFYNSEGNLFIVMGYCECGDLYSFIRNQNGLHFREEQIVDWFVQICMALKYLHDRNILHRDLKTQNIFLTKNKLIKVGDLGIARVLNGKQDMATTLVGTPYYMSPEIFAGRPYNQKSDVWALGCCIYETATLKQAFNAHSLYSLMQKVMKKKLSVTSEHYTSEFWNIVSSMLNHDPNKRPSVTDILLDDYIRKHILLFLQDTTKSANSFRSKSVVGGSSEVGLDDRSNCSRPLTHPLLFHNTARHHSETKKRSKQESARKSFAKIPDINGNGDGNDNSQQRSVKYSNNDRAIGVQKNKSQYSEAVSCKTDSIASSLPSTDLNNSFKENMRPKRQQCTNNALLKISEFENVSKVGVRKSSSFSTAERNNSLNSFKILNNLTYTIKNTRFNYRSAVANAPKSAQELVSHSKKKDLDQLYIPTNVTDNLEHVNISRNSWNGESFLPKVDGYEKLIFSDDFKNTAPYHIDEIQNCPAEMALNSKELSRNNVDKGLLQEIMKCNGTKIRPCTNSAARQRRRELHRQEIKTDSEHPCSR